MIIYKATNLINGKVYIGQTTRPLKERIREHNHTSKGGRFLTYFYRAILKHGKNNFQWDIIDKAVGAKDLDDKEKYWKNSTIQPISTLAIIIRKAVGMVGTCRRRAARYPKLVGGHAAKRQKIRYPRRIRAKSLGRRGASSQKTTG